MRDLIIIGSGPAGLTAAIYAARAKLNPLVFAGIAWGGQLMTTTEVENFPGFPDGVLGPQLMDNMMKQAQKFGAEIKFELVTNVDFSSEEKKVITDSGEYAARSIIIATGAAPRKLGVPGEKEFWAKGVSSCATCDGAFFRNKVVAVVGGGDSAMEEAQFLTRFASKVFVIHRKEKFNASKIMQEKVLNNEKIEVLFNTEIKEIKGDSKVTSLHIFKNTDNSEKDLPVDGLFLGIGQIPVTEYLNNQVELNDHNYVKAKDEIYTSVDGVFVAGDVEDHIYRQAVTAAGAGCKAAIIAERWLMENS